MTGRRGSRHRRPWLLAPLLAWLLGGCPQPQGPPPRPDGAPPCERHEDCNDRTCGLLRACVDGLCEAEPSLSVPCREGEAAPDGG